MGLKRKRGKNIETPYKGAKNENVPAQQSAGTLTTQPKH
jgi:hypothetical protein